MLIGYSLGLAQRLLHTLEADLPICIHRPVHPHEANEKTDCSITGHVHLKVKLPSKGRQSESLAVFAGPGEQLILLAFGRMTGGHFNRHEDFDEIYLCAQEQVLKCNDKRERARSAQ